MRRSLRPGRPRRRRRNCLAPARRLPWCPVPLGSPCALLLSSLRGRRTYHCGQALKQASTRPLWWARSRGLGIDSGLAYHGCEDGGAGRPQGPKPALAGVARTRGMRQGGSSSQSDDPRGARREVPAIIDSVLRAGEGKLLRRLKRIADQVNSIEEDFAALSDAELRAMTDEFRQRHEEGESLDDLLPEAFAAVREAAKRTLGQRHFDVQLMGGAALHIGNIAEMKTGEGKTLTGVLPAYLNALSGRGVHVVTVNDYLAKRDSEWMGRIHRFLG